MLSESEIDDEDIELLRIKHIQTGLMVLFGYILTQLSTLVAKILGLTSMSYSDIAIIALSAIIITIVFIIIMLLVKNSTRKFGNFMFYSQYVVFIIMYNIWIFKLHEVRLLGLVSALIAVTFVVFYTNYIKSLFISIGTITSQILTSYYAINCAGQSGSLSQEIFYTASFMPSFMFISYIAREIQMKSKRLRDAQKNLEKLNKSIMESHQKLEEERLKERTELELASHLQSQLLPKEPVKNCGWDIAFYFRPSHDVSGDFYDFYSNGGNLCGISLFDVAGHGLSAGLITMIVKPILSRLYYSMKDHDLGMILEYANREITHEITNTDILITGVMLRMIENEVEFVNSGHPDFYFKKASNGDIETIRWEQSNIKGRPIGFSADTKYQSYKMTVSEGDTILLFTDCILESRDESEESYGSERLMASFKDSPDKEARDILNYILYRFFGSVKEEDIRDDFTLIVAKKL